MVAAPAGDLLCIFRANKGQSIRVQNFKQAAYFVLTTNSNGLFTNHHALSVTILFVITEGV